MSSHIQFFAWHKTKKILLGPRMVVNQPRWIQDALESTVAATGEDSSKDPAWVGGTLEKILRIPDVDRGEVAQALGVRRP